MKKMAITGRAFITCPQKFTRQAAGELEKSSACFRKMLETLGYKPY